MQKNIWIKFLLILSLSGLNNPAIAQKEGNVWYFGNHAGIDFNTGAAFALTDGAMLALNGCATISNAAGKLLFYTDGITVYDKTHHVMFNGTGLNGGLSSTQSAIIVPRPFSTSLYYIFTVDYEMGPNGLEYSIVDITKNGGNGEVVTKNVLIKTPVCEKLTAVQASDTTDFWVIAHDDATNYLAYLVTSNGVQTTPVISGGGVDVGGSVYNAIGYLKLSSGGNKLASAVKFLNLVEIGNFDNLTGKVSNLQTIPSVNTAYGIEFSPDNTKLYTTNYFDQKLYQFDISSGNISTIINSRVTIHTSPSALSAIQLAPDGKIYVSRDAHGQMGVINKPNQAGTLCNYNDTGFYLNGKNCYAGLPTFVQSFFIAATDFTFFNTCSGDGTQFVGKTNLNPDSWYWDFGDPSSASSNFDTIELPVHHFSSQGKYLVKMVITINGIHDTIKKTVVIGQTPVVNLGPNRITCEGLPIKLDAGNPGLKYKWSTGDSTQTIKVDSTGTYWVRVYDSACSVSDTVKLTFNKLGNFSLGHDTSVCGAGKLTLTENLPGAKYIWSTGETDSSITVTKTGYYSVKIIDGPCTVKDSILVFFDSPPLIKVAHSSMLCQGDTEMLDAGLKNVVYLWSTGAKTQKIVIRVGGQYWLKVLAGGCTVYDSFDILHCPANVFVPEIFSPNGDDLNDTFKIYGTDIAQAEFIILNRWGEIVYNGDALVKGWDGRFKGIACPEGVYAYKLIYREYEGVVLYDRLRTGMVMLVR